MSKKLYVGNLPFDIQESSLREFFETEGRQVSSVQIIMDRQTGRSRGFGFVELDSEDAARTAIEQLNGKQLNGRALVVSEAREPSRNSGGFRSQGGGGGGGGGGRGGFGSSGGFGGRKRDRSSNY